MKSASAWMVGLVVLVVMAGLALPPRLAAMQSELQTRINATLADSRYKGVVAVARGQAVELYLTSDFKGNDGVLRLKVAEKAVSGLKGLDGLTHQGGWWFGPVTTVSVNDDRVSLEALEASKGVSLQVPEAHASSASSASSVSPTPDDLAAKCNGGIQSAIAGRTFKFSPDGDSLTPESEPVLDSLVAALRNCPSNIMLSISGLALPGEATDPKGPAFQRARTIADGMVLRGYDPYRLAIRGIVPGASKAALPKDGQGEDRQVIFLAVAR